MALTPDIWQLVAGIALFILGMRFLEESLKQLAGRSFKLFLRKHTTNKFKGIMGGAVVTGILQSSSVVNIMVLAFVGAGVINMQNALALMLGSNLGTTLTSWIIATVGFKFNIEALAYPITGFAGIAWAFTRINSRWYEWLRFIFGFGLLLLALQFMKEGATEAVKNVDLTLFNKYPALVFVLIGVAITSIIQSSSATVALVLTALYSGGITLYTGAAIVLGAEIGTTVKLLVAAQGEMADKKRVALGNFLFNSITTLVVFLLLKPILGIITQTIGIKDELISLVFFQSSVNIIGILLFFPLLNFLGKYLEKKFRDEKETSFIHLVKPGDWELSLPAIDKEIRHFTLDVMGFFIEALNLKKVQLPDGQPAKDNKTKNIQERYNNIKELHGNIQSYYLKMQGNVNDPTQVNRLEDLLSSLRNAMYGAKSMKDAWLDAEVLRNSSNESKYNYYNASRERMEVFLQRLTGCMDSPADSKEGALENLYYEVAKQYNQAVQTLYKENSYANLSETELTTIINYNRELYTAKKSILLAVKDYSLSHQDAARFNDLPGFIR